MEQIRQDLKFLEDEFKEMKKKLNEIHSAIVGSPLLKGEGIVARLLDTENKCDSLTEKLIDIERRFEARVLEVNKRMYDAEKKQIKYNVYTIVMWTCLGAVAMAIFMYLIKK